MTAIIPPVSARPGRLEQRSTRIAFFIAGFGVAAWAPLVPYAKARAGLDDGTLGLLLLCLGVGSILSMPMAGMLASRFGCRRVLSGGTLLICLALPLLATMRTLGLPLLMQHNFLRLLGCFAPQSSATESVSVVAGSASCRGDSLLHPRSRHLHIHCPQLGVDHRHSGKKASLP